MDINEVKKHIVRLNKEIEEVLREAGYPKCCAVLKECEKSDIEMQISEVITHLGYVNSVVKEWVP